MGSEDRLTSISVSVSNPVLGIVLDWSAFQHCSDICGKWGEIENKGLPALWQACHHVLVFRERCAVLTCHTGCLCHLCLCHSATSMPYVLKLETRLPAGVKCVATCLPGGEKENVLSKCCLPPTKGDEVNFSCRVFIYLFIFTWDAPSTLFCLTVRVICSRGLRWALAAHLTQEPSAAHKDVPLFLLAKVDRVVVRLIQRQSQREKDRKTGEFTFYRYPSYCLKYILYVTLRK